MNKTAEILSKQKRQNQLKKEVKNIKKKLPSFFIGVIFFVAVILYFIENKFNIFFVNNVNFITGIVLFLCLFSLIFVFISYHIINKKKKEDKALGLQLYHLMKLEVAHKK